MGGTLNISDPQQKKVLQRQLLPGEDKRSKLSGRPRLWRVMLNQAEEVHRSLAYNSQLQFKVQVQREGTVRSVSVVRVERIITHPVLLSGLTVISVYSGIVFHVKSYFKNQILEHVYKVL